MQPCASQSRDDKRVSDDTAYEYDRAGRLIAATTRSHYGTKTEQRTETCTRDDMGHLMKCKRGDTEKIYLYQNGLLARTEYAEGGRTVERRDNEYDSHNRLIITRWRDTHNGPGTTEYTYNPDGTLAKLAERYSRGEVVVTFAYDHGRLIGYHSEPGDKTFQPRDVAYRYDDQGRVIEETEGPQHEEPSMREIDDPVHGKVLRIGGGRNERVTYTYDPQGRLLKQLRDLGEFTFITTYDYSCK
jgi:YD repeat-containing protein